MKYRYGAGLTWKLRAWWWETKRSVGIWRRDRQRLRVFRQNIYRKHTTIGGHSAVIVGVHSTFGSTKLFGFYVDAADHGTTWCVWDLNGQRCLHNGGRNSEDPFNLKL